MKVSAELTNSIDTVLDGVFDERVRQEAKWGQQNHPSFSSEVRYYDHELRARFYGIDLTEQKAKANCEGLHARGEGDYASILVEEVVEALCAASIKELREELIQVAAVAVAWVESIDRNELKPELAVVRQLGDFARRGIGRHDVGYPHE